MYVYKLGLVHWPNESRRELGQPRQLDSVNNIEKSNKSIPAISEENDTKCIGHFSLFTDKNIVPTFHRNAILKKNEIAYRRQGINRLSLLCVVLCFLKSH